MRVVFLSALEAFGSAALGGSDLTGDRFESVDLGGPYGAVPVAEDDPSPGEVSEVFGEGGNSQEAREAMAAGLRPLVSYLRRLKRALTCNCNCHHHVKIPRC